jgi:CHAT domain-containing protein
MISRFYQLSLISSTLVFSLFPFSWGKTTLKIAQATEVAATQTKSAYADWDFLGESKRRNLVLAQFPKNERKTEAQTLLQTGQKQLENNQAEAAIKSFQQALTIYQELKDRQGEGETLKNLGNAYAAAGNNTKAMEIYQQTLTISREIKNRDLEARALQNIGTIYRLQENYTKAVEYLEPALLVAREIKSQELELKALVSLGIAYDSLGNLQKVAEYYEQLLPIARQIKNTQLEALTLVTLGYAYTSLENQQKAIEFGEPGLKLAREIKQPELEAMALVSLGYAYLGLENYQKAVEFAEPGLAMIKQINNPQMEAYSLLVSGLGYASLENHEKALDLFQQSLAKAREQKDDTLASLALNLLGGVHRKLGKKTEAIALYQQAISIDSDYSILAGIARVYRDLNSPITAITYYKQAINEIEQIRGKISGLPVALQKSFLQAVQSIDRVKTADIYRELADLLLSQGRILEAQQVLELLKTEELREYTRSGGNNPELAFNQTEAKILQENGSLIQFGQKLYQCQLNQCNQLSQLLDLRDVLIGQFNQKVQAIEKEIRQRRAQDDAFFDPTKISKTQEIVEAQPATVLIYPLVLEDKIWLLLASPGGVVKTVEVPVNRRELGETVVKFRLLLQQPNSSISEVQATGKKLYDWLIKPLETELKTSKVKNLIFSLDRVTRYIPMSALYDGQKYLIENYNVSTVLSADLTDMRDRLPPGTEKASILALGLSNAVAEFNALPFVPDELDVIVRQKPEDPKGIYPGLEFINQTFDFKALRDNLAGRNILHIATHGKFVPGSPDASYLLLGNGSKLTIPDIKKLPGLSYIHLVVLSACETALGGPNAEGIEISGLSYYFLNGGAKSVMASLWQVNDGSTSQLMQNFYSNLANNANDTQITKAAALRQAQLKFLQSNDSGTNLTQRGITAAQPVKSNLSHPYYWAPFVLIGNSL